MLNNINNNEYDFAYGYRKNKEIEKLKEELSGLKNLVYLKENKNSFNSIQEQFLSLKKENNELKKSLEKINNINSFHKIIKENNKLKKELNDLKKDYFNLRNELLLNKKLLSVDNPISHKPMKNSLSQGNIFKNNIGKIPFYNTKNNKRQLKKIEKKKININRNDYLELSTGNVNKRSKKELIELFKSNKILNKKPKLKNISNKISVINPKLINKKEFVIKKELKSNKIILSSLKRLQLINNFEEKSINQSEDLINKY